MQNNKNVKENGFNVKFDNEDEGVIFPIMEENKII